MNMRFRKRIKLFPAVYLNVGKSGITSLSLGGRWVSFTVGREGVFLRGSLVGTGLSFRKRIRDK